MTEPVATNWIAITGAPSSGKTSVIDVLAAQGYAVQPEVARDLIEKMLKAGLTLAQIRETARVAQLQRDILAAKMAWEETQDPQATVFMDRGVPDSMAYFRLAGLDPEIPRRAALRYRYRAVFIFDPLPVVHDGVRNEDEATAASLGRMFHDDYVALGYSPVIVPVLPIAARADFILRHLSAAAA